MLNEFPESQAMPEPIFVLPSATVAFRVHPKFFVRVFVVSAIAFTASAWLLIESIQLGIMVAAEQSLIGLGCGMFGAFCLGVIGWRLWHRTVVLITPSGVTHCGFGSPLRRVNWSEIAAVHVIRAWGRLHVYLEIDADAVAERDAAFASWRRANLWLVKRRFEKFDVDLYWVVESPLVIAAEIATRGRLKLVLPPDLSPHRFATASDEPRSDRAPSDLGPQL